MYAHIPIGNIKIEFSTGREDIMADKNPVMLESLNIPELERKSL